ncbi:hypothetical protein PR048_025201 [Dryococelus australis]|uniref:Uncharacterized protein n=1 Tax=Dryococelus australis TaxID=614101 RepID=A0ABQ9GQQ3_9NEOP|nr:hypothetical protein PR048_025201 [Dryococelus australis]
MCLVTHSNPTIGVYQRVPRLIHPDDLSPCVEGPIAVFPRPRLSLSLVLSRDALIGAVTSVPHCEEEVLGCMAAHRSLWSSIETPSQAAPVIDRSSHSCETASIARRSPAHRTIPAPRGRASGSAAEQFLADLWSPGILAICVAAPEGRPEAQQVMVARDRQSSGGEAGGEIRRRTTVIKADIGWPAATSAARNRNTVNPRNDVAANAREFLSILGEQHIGAVVVQWLYYSPLTLANRARFPAGPSSDFVHVGIVPDDAAVLGDLPFPTPLHSSVDPYTTHLTLTGSQVADVKSLCDGIDRVCNASQKEPALPSTLRSHYRETQGRFPCSFPVTFPERPASTPAKFSDPFISSSPSEEGGRKTIPLFPNSFAGKYNITINKTPPTGHGGDQSKSITTTNTRGGVRSVDRATMAREDTVGDYKADGAAAACPGARPVECSSGIREKSERGVEIAGMQCCDLAKEATEFTCSEYWDMPMAMGASGGQAPCMLHASNMRKGSLWLSGYTARLPPRRTGFKPPGSVTCRIFASGKRCRWSTGFLVVLPSPPPPHSHSGAAPFSPHFTLSTQLEKDLCLIGYCWLRKVSYRLVCWLATCFSERDSGCGEPFRSRPAMLFKCDGPPTRGFMSVGSLGNCKAFSDKRLCHKSNKWPRKGQAGVKSVIASIGAVKSATGRLDYWTGCLSEIHYR